MKNHDRIERPQLAKTDGVAPKAGARPQTEQPVRTAGAELPGRQAPAGSDAEPPIQVQPSSTTGPLQPKPARCTSNYHPVNATRPAPPPARPTRTLTLRPAPPPCCQRPDRPHTPRNDRTSAPPSNPRRTGPAPAPATHRAHLLVRSGRRRRRTACCVHQSGLSPVQDVSEAILNRLPSSWPSLRIRDGCGRFSPT